MSPALGFRANLALDLATAARAIPQGRWLIPLIVFAIGAGLGLLRPGYHSIYGESLLAIGVLVAVGAFGRGLGTVVVVVHGAGDIIRFLLVPDQMGSHVNLHDIVGRVLIEGVLWLAVVLVPSIARRAEWTVEIRLGPSAVGRYLGTAAGAIVAGFGAWVWSNGMPYLTASAYEIAPLPATLQPYQHPVELAVAVGAAYLIVGALLRRRAVEAVEVGPFIVGLPRHGVPGLVLRVVAYVVAILAISGMLTGPLDVGVLAVSCLVAEIGAWIAGRPAMTRAAARFPARLIFFFGAGLLLLVIYLVTGIAISIWPNGLPDSRFWPIVLGIAVAFPIARTAFSLATNGRTDGQSVPVTASVIGALGIMMLTVLVVPQVVFADNCPANLGDCLQTTSQWIQTLTFALFTGGLSLMFTGLPGSKPPPPPPPPPPPEPSQGGPHFGSYPEIPGLNMVSERIEFGPISMRPSTANSELRC